MRAISIFLLCYFSFGFWIYRADAQQIPETKRPKVGLVLSGGGA